MTDKTKEKKCPPCVNSGVCQQLDRCMYDEPAPLPQDGEEKRHVCGEKLVPVQSPSGASFPGLFCIKCGVVVWDEATTHDGVQIAPVSTTINSFPDFTKCENYNLMPNPPSITSTGTVVKNFPAPSKEMSAEEYLHSIFVSRHSVGGYAEKDQILRYGILKAAEEIRKYAEFMDKKVSMAQICGSAFVSVTATELAESYIKNNLKG